MKQIQYVAPKFGLFDTPVWCHHHCRKISVITHDKKNRTLLLRSRPVSVTISPDREAEPGKKRWIVQYSILQPGNSWSKGYISMTNDELKTAFGISDKCDERFGQWLLNVFGGSVALQGKYIRCGNYLNMPGPGHGNDGDPNVSIYLESPIKQAIRDLIK